MDWKVAWRAVRRNPGFTLLAVLVMALGIGANTAVFSVINAVLLRPLDYRQPDRIVMLSTLWKKSGGLGQVSGPDFRDWRGQSTAFAAMARYAADLEAATANGSADFVHVAGVGSRFFEVFGVLPAAGRLFNAEEEKPGSGAAVVSETYWQSRFGGSFSPGTRAIRMFGRDLAVVGVAPARFQFPEQTDIWVPLGMFPGSQSRSAHNYRVVARLKDGARLEQARAQVSAIATRLERQFPESNLGKSAAVTPLRDYQVRNVRLTLYLLLGSVALVLLIACANMANLLLAKAGARTREIAIRAAVGAGRLQILRQLLTESLVLAALAGAAGLLLGAWGAGALVALAPASVPRLAETGLDGRVLAFTLAVSALSSILFGLAPALQVSRVNLSDALKLGGGRAVVGGGGRRLRGGLVVAEIALSMILLAGAGLLIKAFVALNRVDLGFHPQHVLLVETNVPAADLAGAHRATRFYQALLGDAAGLPGVSAVGATRTPPGQMGPDGSYVVDQPVDRMTVHSPQAVFSVVAPGTFATLGIPMRAGRDFDSADTADAPAAAIINEALARLAFGDRDPLGHSISCGMDLDSMKFMRIVGVVGNVRQYGPGNPPRPEIFMPYEQHPMASTSLGLLVRTILPRGGVAKELRRLVRARSAEVPVRFGTLEEILEGDLAVPRFRMLLLGVFAGLAVCLAMAGVYGVTAHYVAQRAPEIGLRMALGASHADVLRLVLRRGASLVAAGVALGLAGAAAASRVLAGMLFEVRPGDPVVYAGMAALLGAVAMAAMGLPAWRAARVDPLTTLRQE